jgi:hypothetical protein
MFLGRLLFFPLFPAIAFYLYEVTAPTLHKFFPGTFTNTGRRVNPQDVKRRKEVGVSRSKYLLTRVAQIVRFPATWRQDFVPMKKPVSVTC